MDSKRWKILLIFIVAGIVAIYFVLVFWWQIVDKVVNLIFWGTIPEETKITLRDFLIKYSTYSPGDHVLVNYYNTWIDTVDVDTTYNVIFKFRLLREWEGAWWIEKDTCITFTSYEEVKRWFDEHVLKHFISPCSFAAKPLFGRIHRIVAVYAEISTSLFGIGSCDMWILVRTKNGWRLVMKYDPFSHSVLQLPRIRTRNMQELKDLAILAALAAQQGERSTLSFWIGPIYKYGIGPHGAITSSVFTYGKVRKTIEGKTYCLLLMECCPFVRDIPIRETQPVVIGKTKNGEDVLELRFGGSLVKDDKVVKSHELIIQFQGTIEELNELFNPYGWEIVQENGEYILRRIHEEKE